MSQKSVYFTFDRAILTIEHDGEYQKKTVFAESREQILFYASKNRRLSLRLFLLVLCHLVKVL